MRNQNGYTMIELLISLSLSLLLFSVLFKLIHHQLKYPDHNVFRQNQIGILQLRRYLSLGLEHSVEEDKICMIYKDEEFCFYQYDSSLIGIPGTQYFLVSVDDVLFSIEDKWLMIEFNSLEKKYKYRLIFNEKF